MKMNCSGWILFSAIFLRISWSISSGVSWEFFPLELDWFSVREPIQSFAFRHLLNEDDREFWQDEVLNLGTNNDQCPFGNLFA